MIIDTHLHVIDLGRLSYPWLASVPALNADFSYATYLREARQCGISTTFHMEVDVAEADIENEIAYVSGLAEGSEGQLAGQIAACRPEDPGFAAFLERVRSNPHVRGFRRVLHVMPDELSESAMFRDNVRRLSGTGLTFDLVVLPRQLPQAIALVDHCPDVSFVLDHCGVPDIASGAFHPWKDLMTAIARRPNVTGKISGISAYCGGRDWTVDTLRPWVEHTISVFGWDRVVWGSDWPVCTLAGSLSTWVAATHALIAGASETERTALLSGNATRLWKL